MMDRPHAYAAVPPTDPNYTLSDDDADTVTAAVAAVHAVLTERGGTEAHLMAAISVMLATQILVHQTYTLGEVLVTLGHMTRLTINNSQTIILDPRKASEA